MFKISYIAQIRALQRNVKKKEEEKFTIQTQKTLLSTYLKI